MTEKMKDKNGWLGSVFVLTAGVCWGFIGFFSNHLSEAGYNSVQIAFLRNIVAAAAMWGWLVIFRRKTLKIQWKDLWMFIGTGIFSVVFFNIAYFMTIERTKLCLWRRFFFIQRPALSCLCPPCFFRRGLREERRRPLLLLCLAVPARREYSAAWEALFRHSAFLQELPPDSAMLCIRFSDMLL